MSLAQKPTHEHTLPTPRRLYGQQLRVRGSSECGTSTYAYGLWLLHPGPPERRAGLVSQFVFSGLVYIERIPRCFSQHVAISIFSCIGFGPCQEQKTLELMITVAKQYADGSLKKLDLKAAKDRLVKDALGKTAETVAAKKRPAASVSSQATKRPASASQATKRPAAASEEVKEKEEQKEAVKAKQEEAERRASRLLELLRKVQPEFGDELKLAAVD